MKKKILIYRHCSLGDFIVSLPAIKLIRENNPNAIIYLASLVKNETGFVKPHRIPIREKLINKFIYFEYNILSIFNFFKLVKKKQFDEIYYLNEIVSKFKLKRDYFLFNFIGIPVKKGFENLKYNYKKFNETYYLCKRVQKKIYANDISFQRITKSRKILSKKKYITISFGGRNPLKKWDIKKWNQLILNIFKKKPNLVIKIIGSKNEYENAEKIKNHKKQIYNLCGKTNINQLFKTIEKSIYHISHDDGTMHIASTFQKNSVSIFGKIAEKGRWFPSNPNQKIFFPKRNINDIKFEHVSKKVLNDLRKLV